MNGASALRRLQAEYVAQLQTRADAAEAQVAVLREALETTRRELNLHRERCRAAGRPDSGASANDQANTVLADTAEASRAFVRALNERLAAATARADAAERRVGELTEALRSVYRDLSSSSPASNVFRDVVAAEHPAGRHRLHRPPRPEHERSSGSDDVRPAGPVTDDLGAAWAEAEAAHREPVYLSLSGPFGATADGPYNDHFGATAYSHRERRDLAAGRILYPVASVSGPTPAAALRALAEALRAETPA